MDLFQTVCCSPLGQEDVMLRPLCDHPRPPRANDARTASSSVSSRLSDSGLARGRGGSGRSDSELLSGLTSHRRGTGVQLKRYRSASGNAFSSTVDSPMRDDGDGDDALADITVSGQQPLDEQLHRKRGRPGITEDDSPPQHGRFERRRASDSGQACRQHIVRMKSVPY